jgi:RNA polymerase sigma-70 factor, ECF subfamily
MTSSSRLNDPAIRSSSAARRRAAAAEMDEIDRQLIARISEKDREAFQELYLDYHRRLTRFLSRLLRNPADAEEIVNDTLWIVWTKACEFRGASRVSTWIFGIAYRRSLKRLRTALRYERAMRREILESDATEYVDSKAGEEREAIAYALAQLNSEQRLVLEFAYFLGYSCAEIAEILGAPVNTVKSRMLHARRKPQSILVKENQVGAAAFCMSQV